MILNPIVPSDTRTINHPETLLMLNRGAVIYIMTNYLRTAFYVGVTSDLYHTILEHKTDRYPKSLTARYKLHFCVYHKMHLSIEEAMIREKEIKKWRKEKKIKLINTLNPGWNDLWEEVKKG